MLALFQLTFEIQQDLFSQFKEMNTIDLRSFYMAMTFEKNRNYIVQILT